MQCWEIMNGNGVKLCRMLSRGERARTQQQWSRTGWGKIRTWEGMPRHEIAASREAVGLWDMIRWRICRIYLDRKLKISSRETIKVRTHNFRNLISSFLLSALTFMCIKSPGILCELPHSRICAWNFLKERKKIFTLNCTHCREHVKSRIKHLIQSCFKFFSHQTVRAIFSNILHTQQPLRVSLCDCVIWMEIKF